MEQPMMPDATTRAAALKIMANGRATIAEIAELVGISRQAVRMWAQRANINPVANRENYLANLWAKAAEIERRGKQTARRRVGPNRSSK